MTGSTSTDALWRVLRNDEGRYSLAPAHHPVPAGWESLGDPAPREACLARIGSLWTDMRPDSLKTTTRDGAAA